ncbi:MAG: hypothetical protein EBY81_07630 [Verrucomicrobia bacterium]|nr:hypothetical protein [Verrucomicrobiota bacterium]
MEETNLKKLVKLVNTPTEEGGAFLKTAKPEHIDFLCHMLKSYKQHAPDEIKNHVAYILKSKTARIAKMRMLKAHNETGGGFFDFLKSTGSSVLNGAKAIGSSIASTVGSFYDKAVPYAQKGLEMAKPYVKKYAPEAVAYGVSHIPIVGPSIAPLAKMGTNWFVNKFF